MDQAEVVQTHQKKMVTLPQVLSMTTIHFQTLNEGLALEIVTYLFDALESSASYRTTRNSKRINITSGQIDQII